jgi:hypothetical protein
MSARRWSFSTLTVMLASGDGGGPETTDPLAGLNRPSWQGQAIVPLRSSKATMQPRWVQIAE